MSRSDRKRLLRLSRAIGAEMAAAKLREVAPCAGCGRGAGQIAWAGPGTGGLPGCPLCVHGLPGEPEIPGWSNADGAPRVHTVKIVGAPSREQPRDEAED